MGKRVTSVLGAGAVLDFDFRNIEAPTTSSITRQIIEQKIRGLDEEESGLIKHIYGMLAEGSRAEYLRTHPAVRNYDPQISFEDLFDVIETLHSFSGTRKHEHYPFPLISTLVRSDLDYHSVDYYNAMVAIVEKVIEIVSTYDRRFREQDREQWYKEFWKSFGGELDVFNLNYDTSIEYSLQQFIDGFVPFTQGYERFEPEVLWNAREKEPTVSHLHGCYLYGDFNTKPVENYYSHRDLYKLYPDQEPFISRQWLPMNQAKEGLFYSPIITGLKKTDKICYLPHSFYHAFLAKRIIDNPSLLICGYSFGDLYVNQLLQRHKLIHDREERVIIVDCWPDYANEDNVSLYRYFMDKTTGGLREFVMRLIEGGVAPLDAFKMFKKVADGCWESSNGMLRLYVKGMRHAVENYHGEIMGFLCR
ncbi:MAG: SIR2 family protein [Bacteroidales bacterium]|nr:SIR2 family protein [Bacteroidales bacterium]